MSTTVTDGAFAGRPAAGTQYDVFLPSDCPWAEWDDGAAWNPWGPLYPLTEPPTAGWSWVNQGGATIAETLGALQLETPAEASINLRCRVRAMPMPPWTLTCVFLSTILRFADRAAGVLVRDSGTGRLVTLNYSEATAVGDLLVQYFTDATTWSSTPLSADCVFPQPTFLRVVDDNVNFTFYYSRDGQNWIQIHQLGRTAWLASPDQIGFWLQSSNNTYAHVMTVVGWGES